MKLWIKSYFGVSPDYFIGESLQNRGTYIALAWGSDPTTIKERNISNQKGFQRCFSVPKEHALEFSTSVIIQLKLMGVQFV